MERAEADVDRLVAIDARLEYAFRPPKHLDPLEPSPRKSAPKAQPTKARQDGLQEDCGAGKRASTAELLNRVGFHPVQPPPTLATGGNQVERWVDAIATQRGDAVVIGRQCIEACGMDFDQSVQSLRDNLNFLHRLCPAQARVPREAAENCLWSGEHILKLWRGSNRVLWQALIALEEEREQLARRVDPAHDLVLRQTVAKLELQVRELEEERDQYAEAAREDRRFAEDLRKFRQGESIAKLRADISANTMPSGVTKLLDKLSKRMQAGQHDTAKLATEARRRSLRLDSPTYREAVPGFQDGEDDTEDGMAAHGGAKPVLAKTLPSPKAVVLETPQEAEEDAHGEESEPKDQPEPEEGESGGPQVAGQSADSVKGGDSGSNSNSSVARSPADLSAMTRGSLRKASLVAQNALESGIGSLDDIQRSLLLAKLLADARQPVVAGMISALAPRDQKALGLALLEAVADGKAVPFLQDVMRHLDNQDRLAVVFQFLGELREEEAHALADRVAAEPEARLFRSECERAFSGGANAKTKPVSKEVQTDSSDVAERASRQSWANDSYAKTSLGLLNAIESKLRGVGAIAESDSVSSGSARGSNDDVDTKLAESATAPATSSHAEAGETTDVESEPKKEGKRGRGNNSDGDGDNNGGGDNGGDNSGGGGGGGGGDGKESRSDPTLDLSHVQIHNRAALLSGEKLAVTVTLRRIINKKTGASTALVLPWEKYLHKPPKGRKVRTMERQHFENDIIGEVFMKKVLADKSMRGAKKGHTLAKSILHFFTQKYGLRKLAEEYLYGIVKSIREHHASSPRIKLFGLLVGIVRPDCYSPQLCDVVMEVLGIVFRPDQIAKVFQHGSDHTVVNTLQALRAVRSMFHLVEGDRQPSMASTSTAEEGEIMTDTRTWTMPGALRQRLLRWIESNSVPESEIDQSTSSDIKVVNCDRFLHELVEVFIIKLRVDQTMLMELFCKFDRNGDGVLSFDEYTELIRSCQPRPPLTEGQIMDLWIETNDMEKDEDDDQITAEGFASVCMSKQLQLPYWKHDNEGRMLAMVEEEVALRREEDSDF